MTVCQFLERPRHVRANERRRANDRWLTATISTLRPEFCGTMLRMQPSPRRQETPAGGTHGEDDSSRGGPGLPAGAAGHRQHGVRKLTIRATLALGARPSGRRERHDERKGAGSRLGAACTGA